MKRSKRFIEVVEDDEEVSSKPWVSQPTVFYIEVEYRRSSDSALHRMTAHVVALSFEAALEAMKNQFPEDYVNPQVVSFRTECQLTNLVIAPDCADRVQDEPVMRAWSQQPNRRIAARA